MEKDVTVLKGFQTGRGKDERLPGGKRVGRRGEHDRMRERGKRGD